METIKSFPHCLHPTPFGFLLGALLIAFSLGLWVWMLAQLGGGAGDRPQRHSAPMAFCQPQARTATA
jgi:hypothetical protein